MLHWLLVNNASDLTGGLSAPVAGKKKKAWMIGKVRSGEKRATQFGSVSDRSERHTYMDRNTHTLTHTHTHTLTEADAIIHRGELK